MLNLFILSNYMFIFLYLKIGMFFIAKWNAWNNRDHIKTMNRVLMFIWKFSWIDLIQIEYNLWSNCFSSIFIYKSTIWILSSQTGPGKLLFAVPIGLYSPIA